VRSTAKRVLSAWYGGSYRGTDLSPAKTGRRRSTHERRAGLAVTGTPVDEQPASAAGVDRAWRALDPDVRRSATETVAEFQPDIDLSAIGRGAELDAADAELRDFFADTDDSRRDVIDELEADGGLGELGAGDDEVRDFYGAVAVDEPEQGELELGGGPLLAGGEAVDLEDPGIPDEIDGWDVWPDGPRRAGHFWKRGPVFDDPWSAART
jgi:hypothetical protein